MANDLTFDQVSTLFTEIVAQATGKTPPAVVDTASFVSVAQTALLTGMDPMMTAISQVMARTIFSIRPYYSKFKGLRVNEQQYGNHVRKINPIDPKWVDDPSFEDSDNKGVDHYKAPNPKALQTNWYGEEAIAVTLKTWRYQLDNALRGPDEFGQMYAMWTQNVADAIEQKNEAVARMVLANLIGGVYSTSSSQVIHLLSEYNAETGKTYDAQTIRQPENYPAFVQWMYGRIAGASASLTDRTQLYHINVTGKEVNRHTPYERQRVYLLAKEKFMMENRVLADIYHDNYMRLADTETLNFWQSPLNPDTLYVSPIVLQPSGALSEAGDTAVPNLFGVIMDEEACGYTITNHWISTTPINSAGGFWVTWWHFLDKYWNDFTENVIVLCLD